MQHVITMLALRHMLAYIGSLVACTKFDVFGQRDKQRMCFNCML
jgi:hypothetical protein